MCYKGLLGGDVSDYDTDAGSLHEIYQTETVVKGQLILHGRFKKYLRTFSH